MDNNHIICGMLEIADKEGREDKGARRQKKSSTECADERKECTCGIAGVIPIVIFY